MTIKPPPVSRLALAISLTTGYAVQSYGQEPTGTKPAQSFAALEEVVVTAQRREQQLIEVPISITALSADQLSRSGISSNAGENYDASGDDMIRSPKVTGFLNADYTLYTSISEFGVFGSAYYNDGYNMEVTGYIKQDSFTLYNAELSFIPASLPDLRFVLWGRNLTDEDYLNSLLQNPFANGMAYADPRTYGARMEWNF